jgi:hypothetical protein
MSELADIYQIRTKLETALAKALVAKEFSVVTRANKPANFQQIRPRLELVCQIGAATGHKNVCPDGLARFDCYRVTTSVQAITAPANNGVSGLHEIYVGTVRGEMSTLAQYSFADTNNFPELFLAVPLRDSGTVSTLKAEDGVEYSVLTYDSIVKIRESAWQS